MSLLLNLNRFATLTFIIYPKWKHRINVLGLFKVINKGTRTHLSRGKSGKFPYVGSYLGQSLLQIPSRQLHVQS